MFFDKAIPAFFLVALLLWGFEPTQAHHSVAGQFDVNNEMTWTGTIVKVDWINPHIYVHVDVAGEDGSATRWRLETHPPAMMRKSRLSKSMLRGKAGETVVVTGIPARGDDKLMGYIYKITYEDGHFYQLAQ